MKVIAHIEKINPELYFIEGIGRFERFLDARRALGVLVRNLKVRKPKGAR